MVRRPYQHGTKATKVTKRTKPTKSAKHRLSIKLVFVHFVHFVHFVRFVYFVDRNRRFGPERGTASPAPATYAAAGFAVCVLRHNSTADAMVPRTAMMTKAITTSWNVCD